MRPACRWARCSSSSARPAPAWPCARAARISSASWSRARLVDELFLTVAPQFAGRDDAIHRLALVEGTSFGEGRGRWASLASVRRAGDDLFLRYRFEP